MQNTRGSAEAKEWASARAGEFGATVKHWREKLGLSAAALAKRTEEVGYPITRGTIAKIEGNYRSGKVDLAEVVALASALGVPPIELLFPGMPDRPVEALPGRTKTAWEAARWFTGERSAMPRFGGEAEGDTPLVDLVRIAVAEERRVKMFSAALRNESDLEARDRLMDSLAAAKARLGRLTDSIREAGGVIGDG